VPTVIVGEPLAGLGLKLAVAPSRGGLLSARFEVMIRSTALAQKSFKEPRLLAVPPRPVLP